MTTHYRDKAGKLLRTVQGTRPSQGSAPAAPVAAPAAPLADASADAVPTPAKKEK